jgi:hypothetical protein
MNKLIWILVYLFTADIFAHEINKTTQNWKVFKSEKGYKFSYPSCWNVVNDDIDHKGSVTSSRAIFVEETTECSRPRFSPSIPNGVSLSGSVMFKSLDDAQKNVEKRLQVSKTSKKDDYLLYKSIPTEGAVDHTLYVTKISPNSVRWQSLLICPSLVTVELHLLSVSEPDKEVLNKLRKGELALPHLEREILESLRCEKK